MPKQFNTRLPELTHNQIDEIAEIHDLTKTQILIIAIDRLYQQLQSPKIDLELSAEEINKVIDNTD